MAFEHPLRGELATGIRSILEGTVREIEPLDEDLLRLMQQHAYEHSQSQRKIRQDNKMEQDVQRILKKKDHQSLSPIKDCVKQARKPRMRTVEHYLCDHCDSVISEPTEGFIVHGNIYSADPARRGGMIGNNFPPVAPDEKISPNDVKQTVLCLSCFCKNLGISDSTENHILEAPLPAKRKPRTYAPNTYTPLINETEW